MAKNRESVEGAVVVAGLRFTKDQRLPPYGLEGRSVVMSELRQREPREKDEAHLEKVRWLPCIIVGGRSRPNFTGCSYRFNSLSEPHHVKTKGVLGGDRQVIPLCHGHHMELHAAGRMTFATRYELDYEQAIRETNERVSQ